MKWEGGSEKRDYKALKQEKKPKEQERNREVITPML